jgi:DMSO reductase anchor subunit
MIATPELHSLVDFGMCVVLWLVQLVIYPSFLRVEPSELVAWHKAYTFRVSFVILPLMLGQLALAILTVLDDASILEWTAFALVIVCWYLTFFVSVPLHRKIEQNDISRETRQKLITTNWPRTILWSVIFGLGLF